MIRLLPDRMTQVKGTPLHAWLVQSELNGGRAQIDEIAQLKDRPEVRYLTISGLDQKTLEYVVSQFGHQLLGLKLWKCPKIDSLQALEGLANVDFVSVHWNQRATRLWDFRRNTSLRSIRLFDLSKLENLSDFENGVNLEEVEIGTEITSKDLVVPTLQPLMALQKVKSLVLGVQKILDDSIEPLGALSSLEHIIFGSAIFTTEQVAWLRARLPLVDSDSTVNAFVRTQEFIQREKKVDTLVVGRRKPWLSSTMDAERIKTYQSSFDDMVRFFEQHKGAGPRAYEERCS